MLALPEPFLWKPTHSCLNAALFWLNHCWRSEGFGKKVGVINRPIRETDTRFFHPVKYDLKCAPANHAITRGNFKSIHGRVRSSSFPKSLSGMTNLRHAPIFETS